MVEVIVGSVGVTAPYYALYDLCVSDNEVKAEFTAEQPMGDESGPIAAAEVGRHLAVLGACSLARSNPVKKKHYYIASSAVLRKVGNGQNVVNGSFTGVARTLHINKRDGSVSAVLLTKDKVPLYELETRYRIMSDQLFEKLFKAKKLDFDQHLTNNPYTTALPLHDVHYANHSISARLGPLKPEECKGHFISYPCIPVAILMHALSRTAGKLLSKVADADGASYRVVSADVRADNFAFAGEPVFMDVNYSGRKDDDYVFFCTAKSTDGKQFGAMTLRLSRDTRS